MLIPLRKPYKVIPIRMIMLPKRIGGEEEMEKLIQNLKKLSEQELANLGMEICECPPCDILSDEELELLYSGMPDNCYETKEAEEHLFWLAKEHPLIIIKCLVGSSRSFDCNGRHEPSLWDYYAEILLRLLK